jgi:outer membrane protein OmpA-like peptidoglycan-associated protein
MPSAPETTSPWSVSSTNTISQMVTVKRLWVRRSQPESFLWKGTWLILGLLLLVAYALWPFAKDDIETVVRSELRAALDTEGYHWVNLSVTGQQVALSGTPPRSIAGEEALALARSATCPAWALRWKCAVQVTGGFESSTMTPLTTTLPTANSVTIIASASASAVLPKVSTPTAPIPSTPPTYSATASIQASTPTRTQSTPMLEVPARIVRQAPAPAAPVATGEKTISIAQVLALHPCETEMAAAVGRSRIEFATNSAVLSHSSSAVLDELAKAARRCPGVIQVQGHTDNVGSLAHNLGLSKARAGSVRKALIARGLGAHRLIAQGFGNSKPLASNNNDQGRSKNRRIEFRLMHN